MIIHLLVVVASLSIGITKEAREAEKRQEEADRLAREKQLSVARMVVVEPDSGVARVAPMKPSWCDVVEKVQGNEGSMERNMKQMVGGNIGSLPNVANTVCLSPDDPNWQKQTAYAVQWVMNVTRLDQPSAEAIIRARVQRDKWEKDKKTLCEGLKVGQEQRGMEKAFADARQGFFGCGGSEPSWTTAGGMGSHTDFGFYYDQTPDAPSEILRMQYLFDRLPQLSGKDATLKENAWMVTPYAIHSQDARALDPKKLDLEIAKEPYAGNEYARIVALESMAYARKVADQHDAQAKQLAAKDPDYKTLFFTAPEKGWKDWVDRYAKLKDEMERSNDFEKQLFSPSRKAVQGCSKTLRPDLAALAKTRQGKSAELYSQAFLSDPIVVVLLGRVIACEAIDGNFAAANQLHEIYSKGRYARGPRSATYYAVIEALGKVREDRTQFPWEPQSIRVDKRCSDLTNEGSNLFASKVMLSHDGKGVVKATTKVSEGVEVSFKTEKWVEDAVECWDSKRIWRVENGQVFYFRDCKSAGKETVTRTEKNVVIPEQYAGGIKPGALMLFRGDMKNSAKNKTMMGFPNEVYADKTKKKLVNYYGFGL